MAEAGEDDDEERDEEEEGDEEEQLQELMAMSFVEISIVVHPALAAPSH